jgi:hypothetical protein
MTITYWIGNAQSTPQVATITVTAVAIGGVLTATINGASVSYTCVSGDTVTTAAALWYALLIAARSIIPEFGELTFSNPSGGVITATASSAGTPFTMTKSQSGGATCTLSTTTANVSPSDVINPQNWVRGATNQIPQNGDDVVLANSSVPLLWNLDQLSGVLLNSFTRYQSFVASIGLPELNPLGYAEYRPTYLILGSNVTALPVVLGVGVGNGPSRERYNVGSYRTNLTVIASGSPLDAYAVRFLGSNGANTATILGTTVGVAMLPAETAALNLATVDGGGSLDLGPGVAFSGTGGGGTLTMRGGVCTAYCAPAAIVATNSAQLTLSATSGTYSALTASDGTHVRLTQPMTISSYTLARSSVIDNSANLGAVTLTSGSLDGTCQIIDANNGITFTNAATVNGQVTSGPFVFTGARTVKVT